MTDVASETSSLHPQDAEQLSVLLGVVERITHGSSHEDGFALVADALQHIFGIDRFAIVLAGVDGALQVSLSRGLSPTYLQTVRHRLGESAGARALRERRPIYIRDASVDVEFRPFQNAAQDEGFRTVLVWPLLEGMEPLGYLIMYHNEVREYTAAEIALAQAVVQQAAFAVQQGKLHARSVEHHDLLEERFRKRVAEADAIDEIVLQISSSLHQGNVLQAIVDASARLVGADTAALYLRGEDGLYRVAAAYGMPVESLHSIVLSADDGLLLTMTRTGRPAQVSDFVHQVHTTRAAAEVAHRTAVRATLGVPLMSHDECIGALYVGARDDHEFSPEAVRILRRLNAFAQVALQNAQQYGRVEAERSRLLLQQERARSALLTHMLDLAVLLNSNREITVLVERVVEAAMDLVGTRTGTLGLIEDGALTFTRFHGLEGWTDFDITLAPGEGVPGHVWRTGEPYIANACEEDPQVLASARARFGFRRLAFVPMVDRSGAMLGTLGVYDPIPDRELVQADVEVLQMLAHVAAIAIENARLDGMKDEFLSIVSHELKTPVTAIKGFAQVLRRRSEMEAVKGSERYLDTINQQADRLAALINDLLDLTRIQTGKFVFETNAFDYAALLTEVASEAQLTTGGTVQIPSLDRCMVLGNANRLRQIVINLIDNAATHGPPGGIVQVSVRQEDDMLVTCVTDQGQGVPPGEEEHIFMPYYQVRQKAQRYANGLGIGLFISRRIVEEHGGRIWVDPANRASFCFSVPLARE